MIYDYGGNIDMLKFYDTLLIFVLRKELWLKCLHDIYEHVYEKNI
jgi:hypothetical protein